MQRAELSSRIREEAFRLGFFKVGIVSARSLPPSVENHFNAWLANGFHGQMEYMERQASKRRDPRMAFSETQTMLVLGFNYFTGDPPLAGSMKGRISRYAWGEDYHRIVKDRLERLLRFIQCLDPSARGVCYTDTGPVMEKAWGDQASLGWLGKNACLITRSGSWFFIGVILISIDLECDVRAGSYCGTCSRCIGACPTGALVAPYILDARRCISYLTIELRGPIPLPLRPLMGNRIFGCDACQEACPWNRFASGTAEEGFGGREETRSPDLASLIGISAKEFRLRFRHSPVWRATRDGLVRNVAVALGNSGSDEAVPALAEALQDASPLVRGHAAWGLGRIATEHSLRILRSAHRSEKDSFVLEEIAAALGMS